MAHSDRLSGFVLSKDDIQLPDEYKRKGGVLFGSARMAPVSDETFGRVNKSEEIEPKKREPPEQTEADGERDRGAE